MLEQRFGQGRATHDTYWAWWTDTVRHFHAVHLFDVRPGDELTATLALRNRRWNVSITDLTSGAHVHRSTREEATARFYGAEWLQEDPANPTGGKPEPYPMLSSVGFAQIAVNGVAPRSDYLRPMEMLERGQTVGPTLTIGDSFTVAVLTGPQARYTRLGARFDDAWSSFTVALSRWGRTPRSVIASAGTAYASATRAFVRALAAAHWPPAAERVIPRVIASADALAIQVPALPRVPAASLAAWYARLLTDADALRAAGRQFRLALDPPAHHV